MKINISNPYYFERGTMSLTPHQLKALRANKSLVVVDKSTKATHPVNNKLALLTLVRRIDQYTDELYYTARFK